MLSSDAQVQHALARRLLSASCPWVAGAAASEKVQAMNVERGRYSEQELLAAATKAAEDALRAAGASQQEMAMAAKVADDAIRGEVQQGWSAVPRLAKQLHDELKTKEKTAEVLDLAVFDDLMQAALKVVVAAGRA